MITVSEVSVSVEISESAQYIQFTKLGFSHSGWHETPVSTVRLFDREHLWCHFLIKAFLAAALAETYETVYVSKSLFATLS